MNQTHLDNEFQKYYEINGEYPARMFLSSRTLRECNELIQSQSHFMPRVITNDFVPYGTIILTGRDTDIGLMPPLMK